MRKNRTVQIAAAMLTLLVLLSGCTPAVQETPPTPAMEATSTEPSVAIAPTATQAEPLPTPTAAPTLPEVLNIQVRSTAANLPYFPYLTNSNLPFNENLTAAIHAGLLMLDANGVWQPLLAESVPGFANGLMRLSGEGEAQQLEIEFRLKPGLVWQDGAPLTAADAVFGWEYLVQAAWAESLYAYGFEGLPEALLAEVVAPDPQTVIYRFMSAAQARQAAADGGRLGVPELYAAYAAQDGPVIPLNALEVGRLVFPQHLLAGIAPADLADSSFASAPVLAGAYQVIETGDDGQSVLLQANPNFVLGKPAIELVRLGILGADDTPPYWLPPAELAGAMADGLIHVQVGLPAVSSRTQDVTPADYATLPAVVWSPRLSWELLTLNLDNPHLSRPAVRQAIAQALDRQALMAAAVGEYGSLAGSYLPETHPLYQAAFQWQTDPVAARTLLEQAGYDLSSFPAASADGPLSLRLVYPESAPHSRIALAELIQSQLAGIGIEVILDLQDVTQVFGVDCSALFNSGQFDLQLMSWLSSDPTPEGWIESTGASWRIPGEENGCPQGYDNAGGWVNARVDEIAGALADGVLLTDPAQGQALISEHQQLSAAELPSIPLFFPWRPVVYAADLQGVQPSAFVTAGVPDLWNIYAWRWAE